MSYYYGGWAPYVSVAERRAKATRKIAALRKKGKIVDPVSIEGRKITLTFWGKAWCDNLESYSDFENRLPRGRTYVRNGSVIDLQIKRGKVTALVSGSSIYQVEIAIKPAAKARWRALANDCAGKIDSVVELLQGKFSKGVMEVLARQDTGLFPTPREISLKCSCPDWAYMCKHLAAVLYGVGARLDHAPEKLFVLRGVDHTELIAQVGAGSLGKITGKAKVQVLDGDGLSDIFGIDIEEDGPPPSRAATAKRKRPGKKSRTRSKQGTKSSEKKPLTKKPSGRKVLKKKKLSKKKPLNKKKKKIIGRATRKKPSKKKPSGRKVSKKRSRRPKKITAAELLEMGILRSTFQNWVTSGVLVRTDQRGVYLTTAASKKRLEKALAQRWRKKR